MKLYARVDEVIIALAYCAKQTHIEELRTLANTEAITLITKQADFLLFVHYCAKISAVLRGGGHSNFGHGMCRLIEKWYEKRTPVDLANMFGEHRGLHGWTHNSVIAKAHMRTKKRVVTAAAPAATERTTAATAATAAQETTTAATAAQEPTTEASAPIASSSNAATENVSATASSNENGAAPVLSSSTQTTPATVPNVDEDDREHVFQFVFMRGSIEYLQYLEDKTELGVGAQRLKQLQMIKTNENVDKAIESIRQHNFTLEQLPAHLLEKEKIWEALLPTLSYKTLLNHFHTLKDHGFLNRDSTFARTFVDIIGNANKLKSENICPIFLYIQKRLYEKNLRYLGAKKAEYYEKKVLKRKIEPNQLVKERLDSMFEIALFNAKPAPAKFFVVMDLRKGNVKSSFYFSIYFTVFVKM